MNSSFRFHLILSLCLFISISSALSQSVDEEKLNLLEAELQESLAKLEFAETNENGPLIFQALLELGSIHKREQNYSRAIEYYRRALQYSDRFVNPTGYQSVQTLLAKALFLNGDYQEASEAFQEIRMLSLSESEFNNYIENLDLQAKASVKLERLNEARDFYISLQQFALNYVQDTVEAISALARAAELSNKLNDYGYAIEILGQASLLEQKCSSDSEADLLVQHGVALLNMGHKREALEVFRKAEQLETPNIADVQYLISNLYVNLRNRTNAMRYNQKAIESARKNRNLPLQSQLFLARSNIHQWQREYNKALIYFKQHLAVEEQLKAANLRSDTRKQRIHDHLKDVENRFRQRSLESDLLESAEQQQELRIQAAELEATQEKLENEKKAQELALLQEKALSDSLNLRAAEAEAETAAQQSAFFRQQFLSQQRQAEIERLDQQLLADSLSAAEQRQRQENEILRLERDQQGTAQALQRQAQEEEKRKIRFFWTTGFLSFILMLALASWWYSRRINARLEDKNKQIEEQSKAVAAERERAEQLLLNILPATIAEELKANGSATPLKYDSATVLFTDFVGFTSIASKLGPEEIISELNECFTAFDRIAEKYKLEKIKTIGDSYMCAGGIPNKRPTHAQDAVSAGQEMLDFVLQRNAVIEQNGGTPWPIRVGIHSGEIVAGVVGESKFAYDIWGDTVNVASRMERSAEVNTINISEATHKLIMNKFKCDFRGEIEVKNRGLMGMYKVAV